MMNLTCPFVDEKLNKRLINSFFFFIQKPADPLSSFIQVFLLPQ